MPADYQRQCPELPTHAKLYEAALGFISDGGTYTPSEIRQTIAEVYEITAEHLALRLKDGRLAFHNYVAHVLRSFTRKKFHTREGNAEDAIYTITPSGAMAGRKSIEN